MSESWMSDWDSKAPKDTAPSADAPQNAPVPESQDAPSWMKDWDKAAPATSHSGQSQTQPQVHHAATPTRFQQSTAPTPKDEPELTLGQTLSGAAHNFLPSLGGVGKSVLDSVLHPIKTAEAVGDLGKGAASQLAGAVGVPQDPKTKAANEQLISALENHYKTTYGSVKGFKKAFSTDPASVAMDVSSVIPGIGAAADAAGLAKTASVIGKIGSAVDPITQAVNLAKVPGKIVMGTGRQYSGMMTGVSPTLLKLASDVGAHPDPAVRAAYTKFASGQGDATEFQRAVNNALSSIKQDMSDEYMKNKGSMASTPVDLSGAQQSVRDAMTKAQMGARVGKVSDESMKAINAAGQMVDDVANDPARNTIEHVDALKQQLWNLKAFHPEVADTYLNGIYHGVKGDLVNADPKYAALMEKYQEAMSNVNDLTKTAVGNQRAAASSSLAKSMRAMKTGTGTNLMSQLMEKNPVIGGMMAGQATHPAFAGGRSALEAALAVPAAGAIFSHPMAAALAVPAALASSSPRLAGAINYGAGAASRIAKAVPLTSDAPYYAGRAEEEGNGDEPNPPGDLMNSAKAAISGIESGGNYDAVGPVVHHNGVNDRAIGKYQVMESNIPRWTEAVLGKRMTPEEFRADPSAQEKVFEGVFGKYLEKTGNMKDAASMWHSGVPLDQAVSEGRHDVNMSTADYVKSATGRMGRATGGKTTMTHEQLVERLMKLARAAKKGENAKTETLLNVPDAVVVKALEVAQAAI